jgi:hypothetical protein
LTECCACHGQTENGCDQNFAIHSLTSWAEMDGEQ